MFAYLVAFPVNRRAQAFVVFGIRSIAIINTGVVEVCKSESVQRIEEVHVIDNRPIVRIDVAGSDGDYADEILTTMDHPFYVEGKGWLEVRELTVGDTLSTADADTSGALRIKAITQEGYAATTYNLTVANAHTFFIGEQKVWVHNTGPCDAINNALAGRTDIRAPTDSDAAHFGLQRSNGSDTLYDPETGINYAVSSDGSGLFEVSSAKGFLNDVLQGARSASGIASVKINPEKLTQVSTNPGTAQSRVNLSIVTLDGGKQRGWDYAIGRHGKSATSGPTKSKFQIEDSELRSLLQQRDVVQSQVYNVKHESGVIEQGKFARQIDAGRIIGIDQKGKPVSTLTVLTDRRGNLINVFPGLL
ncbi:polymorphic toxin-type HINT domain-containing protein [Roseobacter sp.]|uniref:polymorphic toxin-type HINT domain-containing protein n=1 Tax=Roseobacter sp. TaxID=1907202 RepID=UPI003859470F